MLYRTHHYPFLFSFNPFTPTSAHPQHHPSTTPLPHLSSSSSSLQVVQGMECVQGALKNSSRTDVAVKTAQQQAFLDDTCVVNSQTAVSGDDFFVDDLLDFSNGFVEEEDEELKKQENNNGFSSASPKQAQNGNNPNPSDITFSGAIDDFCSLPGSELSVPEEDMADLEWLSHFVEDSFSGYLLTYPAGELADKPQENLSEPVVTVQTKPCFTTPVQTKARSKRARTGGRVWSLGSPSLTESSTSSSSSSSSTTSSPPCNPWLIYANPNQTAESVFGKPPAKRQKKKPYTDASGGKAAPQPRRCSHCGVQKTPQWRAGPLGAKTLCNACGVRYKSGRLLPEYRPACSPTFSSELHSNNHRKVLEMRRKKELESGLIPRVQSY